ncbi:hypothetical protein [Schlesneria sp. T3-172]|uniref:hypothetical protein n=1 Tax=Schlesneria sphaerica TaxID=3373610 RepID=UPI0037C9875C
MPSFVRFLICCAAVLMVVPQQTGLAGPIHTVSLFSDGRDEIHIRDGQLVVEHLSWSFPTNLTVDGVAYPLSWNGNTSQPISVPISGDFWIEKTTGRDGGYAVQNVNGYSLAIADNPNGGDAYTFAFYDQPQANTTDWMYVKGDAAMPGRMEFEGIPGYVFQPVGTETVVNIFIDGSDNLMFVDGNLIIEHFSWDPPLSVSINGITHWLTFNGNLSEPIPLPLPDNLQFTQNYGRSALYPIHTAAGLVVAANDEDLGAGLYSLRSEQYLNHQGQRVLTLDSH